MNGRFHAKVCLILATLAPLMGCAAIAGRELSAVVAAVDGTARTVPHPPGARKLRVATYNIHHGAGVDNVLDPRRIAAVLRDVDIALLNEVDVNWARSGFADQAYEIAAAAGFAHYAFGPSLAVPQAGRGTAYYGNAILSRYPILRAERHPLPTPPGREPRTALAVEVEIDGTPLTLIATHLGLNRAERQAQTAALAELVRSIKTPLILAGDLNAHPDAPEVQRLTALLADTHALAFDGPGLTFPSPEPTARIDYILLSQDLVPHLLAHHVPHSQASDHLPVIVEIAWDAFRAAKAIPPRLESGDVVR